MTELDTPLALARQLGQMEGRLSALEHKMDVLEARIENRLNAIEHKIDQLTAALNLGRGGWKALAVGATVLATLMAAMAWLVDHLPWRVP